MKIGLTLLSGGALLLALFGISLIDASPAEAQMKAIQCGAAECVVDSTAKGESNWKEELNSSGSGSGGATNGSGPDNNIYSYKGCSNWFPSGGGQTTASYPAANSSSYSCSFSDGGYYGGGTAVINFQCAPRGDRASNGRVNVSYLDPVTHVTTYKYYFCLYPTDAYAPRESLVGSGKIYTGGQGTFFNVSGSIPNASAYGTSGVVSDTTGYVARGVNLSNPEAWAGSWQPSFSARTATKANGDPLYGYYRLQWMLDYRMCNKYAYPSWLGQPARYDCSTAGKDTAVAPYTYACNQNPALQAGIVGGAKFAASQCDQTWKCSITGNTTLNGVPESLTIMRNGETIDVGFATPNVVGGAVRNPRSWQTKSLVIPGSSPAMPYVKNSWEWNIWKAYKPKGTMAFTWASDDAQHPWQWTDNYRFTADFLLPTQASLGSATEYKWVLGAAECADTIYSPKIEVVRATNG